MSALARFGPIVPLSDRTASPTSCSGMSPSQLDISRADELVRFGGFGITANAKPRPHQAHRERHLARQTTIPPS